MEQFTPREKIPLGCGKSGDANKQVISISQAQSSLSNKQCHGAACMMLNAKGVIFYRCGEIVDEAKPHTRDLVFATFELARNGVTIH